MQAKNLKEAKKKAVESTKSGLIIGGDAYPHVVPDSFHVVEAVQEGQGFIVEVGYLVDNGRSTEEKGWINRFGPTCPACNGTGKAETPFFCPDCGGWGVQLY